MYQKEYLRTENGKRVRRKTIYKCTYGITLEQYDQMFEQHSVMWMRVLLFFLK